MLHYHCLSAAFYLEIRSPLGTWFNKSYVNYLNFVYYINILIILKKTDISIFHDLPQIQTEHFQKMFFK